MPTTISHPPRFDVTCIGPVSSFRLRFTRISNGVTMPLVAAGAPAPSVATSTDQFQVNGDVLTQADGNVR
jgi:hypothetical protein